MHKRIFAIAALGLLSAGAWAFPWDTDMVDAVYLRAFSWGMLPLPEDTVSRNMARVPGDRSTAASQALMGPAEADLANGAQYFNVYCGACHGKDGKGKAPVVDNKSGTRYKVPPPTLSGTGNATKTKTDGYLFFTIRDGSKQMPGYGYAMSDDTIWDVVAYMRTLEGTAYKAPAAEAP